MLFAGAWSAATAAAAQALPGSIEIGGGGGRFYGGSFAKGTTRAFSGKVEVDDDVERGLWLGAYTRALSLGGTASGLIYGLRKLKEV